MAWFCERCGDFLFSIGEDYCDHCKRIRRDERAKRKAEIREAKRNNIIKEIDKYTNKQIFLIKKKYDCLLSTHIRNSIILQPQHNQNTFASLLWAFISNKNNIQEDINLLNKEIKEIEKALKELEEIKNEAFK